jgi:hypothetical protein
VHRNASEDPVYCGYERCSSQKPSQGEACIICFQLACCLSSRHAKKSTITNSAKSSPLASRILAPDSCQRHNAVDSL